MQINKLLLNSIFFFTFSICFHALAQTKLKQILLHLNKDSFISGESIYFGSYLLEKNSKKLYKPEEYVYINLLDDKGKIIEKKVILSINGLSSGSFILNKEMTSGQYFIQTYTYDMNFLDRDYSSIYPVSIINLESGFIPTQLNNSEINVRIFPEGGNLIEGVFSSCAIQIRDAFNKPFQLDSLILSNDKNSKIQSIVVNESGLSKFSLIPDNDIQFRLTAYYRDKAVKIPVTITKDKGYVLLANTNHQKKEVNISISENYNYYSKKNLNPLSLIVEDGSGFKQVEIPIKTNQQKKEIILPYTDLQEGFNTISLLNSNDSILASRNIFILKDQQTTLPQITNIKRENDSLTIHIKTALGGKENFKPSISLSILPEKSTSKSGLLSINANNSQNEILLASNLVRNRNSNFSNEQFYQTDLSLLTDQTKTHKYEFENSHSIQNLSTLDGYVNLFCAENDSLTVLLYSTENNLFETIPLGANEKFQFNNIPLKNKSSISFTLLNKQGESIYANFFFTIQPYSIKYRYSYSATTNQINTIRLEPFENLLTPKSDEIELDEVEIIENKLKYAKFFGTFNGRKVDSTMLSFTTLGTYMKSLGYRSKIFSGNNYDPKRAGSLELYKEKNDPRNRNPIISFPSIVFNGVFSNYVMDYADVRMELIDEIYFLSKTTGVSRNNQGGFFVVFTNSKYANPPLTESDKKSKEFIVNKGYDSPGNFVRPAYSSFDNIGYQKWGVVGWFPYLKPDKNGIIKFKVPDDGEKNLNLQLVGSTINGTLFKQNITLPITN